MKDHVDDNHPQCPDANTLAAFLDHSLSEEERRLVDSHIQACPKCREIVALGTKAQNETSKHPSAQTHSDTLSALSQRLMPFGQLDTGNTIGRYLIVKPLGLGGMGEVYLAYDPELNRRVALKLLRTDIFSDSNASSNVNRPMKEAQAMAQLSHPNVISVYDVIKVEDQVIIAMEYLSGGTLKSWLQSQPRSWREIIEVFISAGQGLAAAHKANLVHRDFEPSNVLLEEKDRVCVTVNWLGH